MDFFDDHYLRLLPGGIWALMKNGEEVARVKRDLAARALLMKYWVGDARLTETARYPT